MKNIPCRGTVAIFIFSVAASLRLRARQILSTEAHFRSTLALDGCWHRLERNLAADVAAAWSGATLTGVRGMAFHAYHASSAMWVDDVRFSNAMTLERNSLLPGAVGHITCRRAVDATDFGHTNTFYFYDHIGNVQGVSSAGGSVAETYTQDAWGNVLSSATTGQWATSFAGRHLTTKEQDGDVGMYYFWQRWYICKTSSFASIDPINSMTNDDYRYAANQPLLYIDYTGLKPVPDPGIILGPPPPSTTWPRDSRVLCLSTCAARYAGWQAVCVAGYSLMVEACVTKSPIIASACLAAAAAWGRQCLRNGRSDLDKCLDGCPDPLPCTIDDRINKPRRPAAGVYNPVVY